ncbi:MAG: hypothetical protein ACT4TC_17130 [Myxococcaceae bacterium]
MGLAICMRCGEKKEGALSPCAACKFDPVKAADPEVQAKSMFLSDATLQTAEIEKYAKQLKAGKAITYDTSRLDVMKRQLRTQQNFVLGPKKAVGGYLLVWGLVLVGVGIAVTAFVLQRTG